MKFKVTFKSITRRNEPVTAILDLDMTQEIRGVLDAAMRRMEFDWEDEALLNKLKDIIFADIDVTPATDEDESPACPICDSSLAVFEDESSLRFVGCPAHACICGPLGKTKKEAIDGYFVVLETCLRPLLNSYDEADEDDWAESDTTTTDSNKKE